MEDVEVAVDEILRVGRELEECPGEGKVTFEARLYRLPPIMFLCHTETVCYVEQYHFWSARFANTPIPVLAYRKRDPLEEPATGYDMHEEMRKHFDWVWEKASVSIDDWRARHVTGTDRGIGETGATSIYVDGDKGRDRILWLLEDFRRRAHEGNKVTIRIQGISLGSFFGDGVFSHKVFELVRDAKAEIQILILDPKSEQAKFRSFRERLLRDGDKTQSWSDYTDEAHKQSKLYRDTVETIDSITQLVSECRKDQPDWSCPLGVREYRSAPYCFVLLLDDGQQQQDSCVLVEQYHYGKLKGGYGAILGTDMPLYEFASGSSELYEQADLLRLPYGLLSDHFDFAFRTADDVDIGC
jgi:hypothetical protein